MVRKHKEAEIKSKHKKKQKSGHQSVMQRVKKKKPAPYQMHDTYFNMAKREGYRARSVYKLKEIQETFGLIEPDMDICDIGAAPGSFIQYIKRIIKDTGNIVGIDLKPIDKYSQKHINTLVHDIFEFDTLRPRVEELIGEGNKFDLITSDIAPNTTGRKDIDQYASVELNIEILKFSDVFLKKGGNLILKVFKGEDFRDLTQEINKHFEKFTEFKPYACRDRSFEEYVICFNKK
ncbi:RlmE family RNA methyltransferase [Candidatus Gracilibacteria bacterium]|nr:RlmE family RNA methyltransferase [Candidatus Gracilibacteria bacterium]